MKKRIGISLTTTNPANYWSWFTLEDLLEDVELVELSFRENNLSAIERCDALLLTGGVDIHPSLYNGEMTYDHQPKFFQLERDRFEEKIYLHAQAHRKPLLGICRGLQLVNVLQGGKLVQDGGASGNAVHKADGGDKEHSVTVLPGSLMHNITGAATGMVNSAHHQFIQPAFLGNNLLVNTWSATADGCIEGIEFNDKTRKAFMLCVQWHPERMDPENAFSKNIKKCFLDAVRQTN